MIRILTLTICLALPASAALAQMHGMHGHATDETGASIHDEVFMPGLVGENTTADEILDMQELFINHAGLTRTVENLPDGIRTVTNADTEVLRDALVNHVASMIYRVEDKFDPHVPIQSPTLDLLFEKPELIVTQIEYTDTGVTVTQTSQDVEIVATLQSHAAEVSDMALRGMMAVHERMMGMGH
ncbi:hypothetical protein [Celeribacter arenosi]|uniref:DUF302 domain-containing protein n=1 Tax=Celeribacter arenosi TaxID=792649 RepID=A0ABP7KH34_9RHOB